VCWVVYFCLCLVITLIIVLYAINSSYFHSAPLPHVVCVHFDELEDSSTVSFLPMIMMLPQGGYCIVIPPPPSTRLLMCCLYGWFGNECIFVNLCFSCKIERDENFEYNTFFFPLLKKTPSLVCPVFLRNCLHYRLILYLVIIVNSFLPPAHHLSLPP
jgi:hypothetical protein